MKLANPAPLGSFGFALTTWLLGMIQANLLPAASTPVVVAMAFAYGGSAQFAAGLMAMAKGNSFNFIANCSFGAFWWSFTLLTVFFSAGVPQVAIGWYLIVWGVFSTAMLVASLTIDRATSLFVPCTCGSAFRAWRCTSAEFATAHGMGRLWQSSRSTPCFLSSSRRDHQRDARPRHPSTRHTQSTLRHS